MFTPSLPDPREYAHLTPKNNLVIAFNRWREAAPAEKAQAEAHVRFLLEQAQASGDDKLVGIALSLMPSFDAYKTLWQWMVAASWQRADVKLVPFALPIVIVAGSPSPVDVSGEVADISWLKDLWLQHGAVEPQRDIWLSNRLISQADLMEITPTMAYEWSCLPRKAHEGWPVLPSAAPLKQVQREAAYLRFLPGVMAGSSFALGAFQRWARDASQILSKLLGTSGATVLALPRAPLPVLAAVEDGRLAQQQIASQLFLGNAIRQVREQGHSPSAILAMHDNHELRVCIIGGEEPYVFSRSIQALDDIPAIEQELVMFLQECQLNSVHVVPSLQPDQINGVRHICRLEDIEPTLM